MLQFIIRRILQLIPVLIGISLITFTLSFIIPGDPVRAIMGQRSDREIELRIRHKFGLDKPWYVQYGIWVRNLIRNPGDLPQCKLRVDSDESSAVYQFKLKRDTLIATDGTVRPVANKPFQRKVLTHLIQRDCDQPVDLPAGGATTHIFVGLEQTPDGATALLENFQGTQTSYAIDADCRVCNGNESGDVGGVSGVGGVGGIELAIEGESYSTYFRPEGFLSGREFTAVFDLTESLVIDGIYDDTSRGHADLRQLAAPAGRTIRARERRGGFWFFTLEDENGDTEEFEMMPNALLMLGGNRARINDFTPGLDVNVAFTNRQDTVLRAIFDTESANLPEVEYAVAQHPDSTIATGRLSNVILSPAIWLDFGRSYRQQREVRDILAEKFVNTAYLTMVAMIIAIVVGVFAGIISAVRPYTFLDYLTMTGALIGVSMPVFWLGLMLILLFQGQLHWIRGIGYGDIDWFSLNFGLFTLRIPWHQEVILPAVTLATVPMAIIARMTRSSMLEVMNLDYIRTARAKGLSEWTVIVRHALKNSLIPIITVIGVNFALLLAGAVLTETVFSWPGLGREIVDAIEFRDFPVVMAGVVLFAFVFVLVNLVVDILYAFVDPRIRYQ